MAKKWQHRRCERCRAEYLPTREAQSYCSPECRLQAAYGRERFQSGTRGPRRRRLEASESGVFTQQKQEPAKEVIPPFWFKISDGLTCTGFTGLTA